MSALVLHLGAHCTDDGLIAGWLARNTAALEAQGLAVPTARHFLTTISQALAAQEGAVSTPAQEAGLLRVLGVTEARQRLVVSAPGLLGPANRVIAPEGFYIHDVARRVYALRVLFPRTPMAFMLAVRRASGIVPGLLSADDARDPEDVLPLLDEDSLPWTPLISAIRGQAPNAPLTVWRHESLPQVWPDVLRGLVGADCVLPLAGLMDMAAARLSAEARLRAGRYLSTNPPATAAQLQRVVALFGERFGLLGSPRDQVVAAPGWVQQQLARLDMSYDTEWEDVSNSKGVRALG